MKAGPKPSTMCALAFNKAIALILKKRLPGGVEASTLHSMGLGTLCRAGRKPAIERDKVEWLLEDVMGQPIKELWKKRPQFVQNVKALTDLSRMKLVGWTDKGFQIDAVTPKALAEVAVRHELTLDGEEEVEIVPKLLEKCREMTHTIDFADMIWLPVVRNLPIRRFDFLFVDESQDLNRCQHEFVSRAGRRLALCGDDRQAIYGFAGADTESMARMASFLEENGGCQTLPLTVTRRCGKNIVEEAKRIVPDFEAHPSNPAGVVIKSGVDAEEMYSTAKGNDMILCRVNAPLTMYAFRMLKAGRKCNIQGRDIGAGLISLVKRFKATTVGELVAKVDDWYYAEAERISHKKFSGGKEMQLMTLRDKRDCVMAFTSGSRTIADVIEAIKKIFDVGGSGEEGQREGFILLSSIHRAKGLESKKVWLLGPELLPHPMAKPEWAKEQEKNLEYVAITRAIEQLTFVPLPKSQEVEK